LFASFKKSSEMVLKLIPLGVGVIDGVMEGVGVKFIWIVL
jgi:hypothetical protein